MAKIPRRGEWQFFRMDNLPGQPWKKYWVLDSQGSEITFSSVNPRQLQYNAEHFRMSKADFLKEKGKSITSSDMTPNPSTRLTGTKMQGRVDHVAARELFLFIQNDSVLYRQEQAIDANLRKKLKRGVFDKALAVKLFMYLADAGAKKYENEYQNRQWKGRTMRVIVAPPKLFNTRTRFAVAAMLTRYWIDARRNEGLQINPQSLTRKQAQEILHDIYADYKKAGTAAKDHRWKLASYYIGQAKGRAETLMDYAKSHKDNALARAVQRAAFTLGARYMGRNPISKKNARRIMAVAMAQAQKRGWVGNPLQWNDLTIEERKQILWAGGLHNAHSIAIAATMRGEQLGPALRKFAIKGAKKRGLIK